MNRIVKNVAAEYRRLLFRAQVDAHVAQRMARRGNDGQAIVQRIAVIEHDGHAVLDHGKHAVVVDIFQSLQGGRVLRFRAPEVVLQA